MLWDWAEVTIYIYANNRRLVRVLVQSDPLRPHLDTLIGCHVQSYNPLNLPSQFHSHWPHDSTTLLGLDEQKVQGSCCWNQ
jgi:hypothetical protein